jgi:hypothetical protein
MIDPKRRCTTKTPTTKEICSKILGQAARVILPLLPTALLLVIGLLHGSTELILIGWAFGCVMWKMYMVERRMSQIEKPTDPFVGY